MIRVSGLHEQLEAAVVEDSADGLSPREQLRSIAQICRRQVEAAAKLFSAELAAGAGRSSESTSATGSRLSAETRKQACQYFRRTVFPVLTPLAVDPGHPFPFLSNLSLSLAVEARDPADQGAQVRPRQGPREPAPLRSAGCPGRRAWARPPTSPDAVREFLPLEQLIAANLEDLFPGMEMLGCFPFRVTRDMDLEIEEEGAGPAVHRRPRGPAAALRRLRAAGGRRRRSRSHPQAAEGEAGDRRRGRLRLDRAPGPVGADVHCHVAPARPARSAVHPPGAARAV